MTRRIIPLLALMTLSLSVWAGGPREQIIDTVDEDGPQFTGLVDVEHEDAEWQIGRKGGRFVTSTTNDPKTFNNIVADETSTTDITERLYAALVRRNQFSLEWEPWLADSWEISADQRTITFTLPQGLRWSDGAPLTSRDFVEAVNRVYYNEGVTGGGSIRNVLRGAGGDSVWTRIDERRFSVTVPNVYAGIFELVSIAPLPMHVFGPLLDEEGPAAVDSFWGVDTDVRSVVSNGPWILHEYIPSQRVVLRPNPHYHVRDEAGVQLPYFSELIFQILPDQDTQVQRFLSGELSYYALRGEDYAVLVDQKGELGYELYNVGPSTSTNFVTFNQNPIEAEGDAGLVEPQLTWLSNRTFRLAMAHLIDRRTIIGNIAFGFGYPQYSFVPSFSPYYWEGAEAAAPKYDPEEASRLLDSIDYIDRNGDGVREDPRGNRISLTIATNSDSSTRVAIATLFAQEAEAVGIEVNEDLSNFNALVGRLTSSYDWEVVVIGLTGSLDPISGANVYPSSGALHMIEPNQTSPRRDWERRVDQAWERAALTTDEAERRAGYRIIQEIWLEEIPWAFTFNAAIMHAYRADIGNIYPHPTEDYDWEGILERMYYRN